jgi:hypothetical protein
MSEEKTLTGRLYQEVEQYVKTALELYKLKALKVGAEVFSSIATGFILWILFLFILLFLSIGAGFYLGKLLGSYHYGFFAVAGIYIIIVAIIYVYRVKCLKNKLSDLIIKIIFKN